ncbi:hypothetical protein C8Q79DRAFT_612051 [Trametes meyenii]|nr:hypothetical protein C8Q79DRAFT_612051 [Trametes meyenii]
MIMRPHSLTGVNNRGAYRCRIDRWGESAEEFEHGRDRTKKTKISVQYKDDRSWRGFARAPETVDLCTKGQAVVIVQ